MANENQQGQHEQQPDELPAAQVELTDEQLEQVVGGSIKVHQSPTQAWPPGPTATIIGPEV